VSDAHQFATVATIIAALTLGAAATLIALLASYRKLRTMMLLASLVDRYAVSLVDRDAPDRAKSTIYVYRQYLHAAGFDPEPDTRWVVVGPDGKALSKRDGWVDYDLADRKRRDDIQHPDLHAALTVARGAALAFGYHMPSYDMLRRLSRLASVQFGPRRRGDL
jgi:hypothetical protein